ncbi:retinol dehydrogenase 11 isoform X2 [Folsomia candida]|uniref:retinol dehydrogenase 11 isoform X2 n=1 Tax=Folsomia candida TaxID=158441 RepID=UPI000B8F99F8|nr:retinol dehydrogenase 11 isoform X2 [Folsomia candida]
MWIETVGTVGVGLVVLAIWYRKRLEKSFGVHDVTDEIDVHGKVVLITGGNSGLGKECATEMAKRGAVVIIASRDAKLSLQVIQEIQTKIPSANITFMYLDLSSLDSIRNFSEEFQKKFDHINILINNAGVYCPLKRRMKTKDGFEFNFGVNHLGHFLLTNLLLETVKRGSPSRIVVVASTLSEKGRINFDDLLLEKEDPDKSKIHAYGNSKLANIVFAKELSERLVGSGVNVYALCPGWVKTDLARYMQLRWWNYFLIVPAAFLFMRSPGQGVQTILHCALSKKTEDCTGNLYKNCADWNTKSQITGEMAEKLWEASEHLILKSSTKKRME